MSNTSISPIELEQVLHSANPPAVFDVRKKPAFEEDPNTLPNATWQVHDEVHVWAENLPRDQVIIVYCVHGHEVSQNASKALRDIGFNAKYLEGGFEDWKQAGLPIVKGAK